MRKTVLAAISCALVCALASCSSEQSSGQTSEEYRVDASIEAVTEPAPAEAEAMTAEETTAPPETTSPAETETAAADTTEPVSEETSAPVIDWTGKWECISLTIEKQTYDGEYMGVPLYAMLAMELDSDGTGRAMSPMAGSDTEVKWSADGSDTINIGTEDDQLPAHMEGELLVMSSPDDGIDYRFERVDSFTEFDYDKWFEDYDYTQYTEAPTDKIS